MLTSIAKQLITADCDLNIKTDNGKTALTLAKEKDRSEIIELLKTAGAIE